MAESSPATTAPGVAALPPEALFVKTVRESPAINVSAVSDSAILAAGQAMCAALDRGETPLQVLSDGLEASNTAPVFLASAAAILCRDHLPAVEQMSRDLTGS